MIGCLNIQCEFCPQYWLWSRWCSQSKVYICFQLSYSATTTATARNKEFFSYMFWRLFGWSAKICDFQPEWHFVLLFVLKDLKREISRFVENGFPIFRSSCWPDLAQGSVCKQVCVVCSVQCVCKQVKWDRRFPTSDSNSHRPSQSHPMQSSRQETRKSRKWFLHFQTLRMLARPRPK